MDRRTHVRDRRVRPQDGINRDDLILDLLHDLVEDRCIDSNSNSNSNSNNVPNAPVTEQPTFTITQLLGGLVACITILGSLIATWVTLNNQITTLKVSTDLIFEQMRRDITNSGGDNKEYRVKLDGALEQMQNSIKTVSDRVENLDNSISQLYTSQRKGATR